MANDHNSGHAEHGSDRTAAFVGLIVGVIVLFGVMRTIVSLTNSKYAGEKPAAGAAK